MKKSLFFEQLDLSELSKIKGGNEHPSGEYILDAYGNRIYYP